MTDRFTLVQEAKSLGLTSKADIATYVTQSQNEAREERRLAHERNVELQGLEARKQERELELIRARLELARATTSTAGNTPGPTLTQVVQSPRLPPWRDSENVEAFLTRFERFATDFSWNDSDKLHQLLSLLSGKALTVYHQLEGGASASYEDLKQALLKAFDITTEEARIRFRTMRIEPNETAAQFAARIKAYFRKYIESDGAPLSYDGVVDLICRETFLKSCPTDLVASLNQRKVKTLGEIKLEAEAWFDAYGHPCKQRGLGNKKGGTRHPSQQPSPKPATLPSSVSEDSTNPSSKKPLPNGTKPPTFRRWRCFNCKTSDHHFTQCPKKAPNRTASAAVQQDD